MCSSPKKWFAILGYGYGLFIFGAACLLWAPVAFLLLLLPVSDRRRRIGRNAIRFGFGAYLRHLQWLQLLDLEIDHPEKIAQGPITILSPNHPGLLDAVILLSLVPDCGCILKASLRHHPLFAASARLAEYIPNTPLRTMIRSAAEELEEGRPLLLFPEGTRTEIHPVSPLKTSPFLISKRAQAPVQTILIDCPSGFLGKHHALREVPEIPVRIKVRLGETFPPSDDPQTMADDVASYLIRRLKAHSTTT